MVAVMGTLRRDVITLTVTSGNIAYGFTGNDDFIDSIGGDWMLGGGGRDRFYSSSGADIMLGGPGDDEFHLDHGESDIMIRGGAGFDHVLIPETLLTEGEANFLRYALEGVLLQMADGGVLDIKGIEHVEFV